MECLLYTGVFQARQGFPSVAMKGLCLTKAHGLVCPDRPVLSAMTHATGESGS